MRWLSRLVALIAMASDPVAVGQGLQLIVENGVRFDKSKRQLICGGPVEVRYGEWVLTSSGTLTSYFDRHLRKNEEGEYEVIPRLRASVITRPVVVVIDDRLRIEAPRAAWLEASESLRFGGKGIVVRSAETRSESVADTSVLVLFKDGRLEFVGDWKPIAS